VRCRVVNVLAAETECRVVMLARTASLPVRACISVSSCAGSSAVWSTRRGSSQRLLTVHVQPANIGHVKSSSPLKMYV